MPATSRITAGAADDLPAPFGPAMTIARGGTTRGASPGPAFTPQPLPRRTRSRRPRAALRSACAGRPAAPGPIDSSDDSSVPVPDDAVVEPERVIGRTVGRDLFLGAAGRWSGAVAAREPPSQSIERRIDPLLSRQPFGLMMTPTAHLERSGAITASVGKYVRYRAASRVSTAYP